ncbi:MAG: Re/Si-specific NAD(P)(+) transhydrogenase subunit alpha [Alcanivorax sp.]|uniref:Re/Si-specific NAD(P)(+) transhydrogenase subunit alpha n=1 Tax=Alloalcanivorax TaxID=3020832 RepID=UPI000796126F|nr:Re/Si-specific NAD(P)(+) transhydrogenase subunit alpha [Alloalcanivorax venustensis]KXJ47037.1 MAG: NAD(P) transhydrogenase subunit alpha [Alcanivorax sp. Nap_24]MAD70609.1 NAD(P)(+) transhydrogenase (Re/Si-specific) subunit alpha [Alcanivorax sp.]MBU74032.1 NAD(P)(+) transhydrogenase (Re/Si-specific) subunit alpha [Spongiibacter sp.]MCH9784437.1 Re/Si-specific NAD(P)(+) transhydrogenase subunit alpha [Gammaproteobacteria bacterium]MEA3260739.1 Re/Si-specific NAD(P)(+) transhydrogenase sub
MIIGVPKEICPGEERVALTPANVGALLKKNGVEIRIERGAGEAAGFTDGDYENAGAKLTDRDDIFSNAQAILQVQTPGSNTTNGQEDLDKLKAGQFLIGMTDPLANAQFAQALAERKVTGLALELIPRITRAQSMDVLSSMAMIAGYKCVLLAANASHRMFPMNMTAAGTMNASRVFVMGAGVAGLQACATAKRLGAIVEAYDVRPAAREQILSVGAKPVELDLDTGEAEGSGGYAKAQGEDFLKRQRELMKEVIKEMDVVITTAAVPGAKSPILVTEEMVKAMKPGSVIVDLAAERGGNCDLTKAGETVVENGVLIIGPTNVPSSVPFHASQMFGKNIENLLNLLLDDNGDLQLDFEDQIVTDTVISHDGDVPHARLREMLGLPELKKAEPEAPADNGDDNGQEEK